MAELDKIIKRRVPVLDAVSGGNYPVHQMDRQWGYLTEFVRRELMSNSLLRKEIAKYSAMPVNERLPYDFLRDLELISLVSLERFKISNYLALDPVPDDQISPDIQSAHVLRETPRDFDRNPDGISVEEKTLVAQRYRFARDVKMLALQAELLENMRSVQLEENSEYFLPSGIKIYIDKKNLGIAIELLSPAKWLKREQLKDRVYKIQVGSSQYILKEQKTARHTDTMNRGHVPGLSSLEEFHTAQYFQEHGSVESGNVRVNWEKPLASVVFPDGFQFSIFEFADRLIDPKSILPVLSEEIQMNKSRFLDEFEKVKKNAVNFMDDTRLIHFNTRRTTKIQKFLDKLRGRKSEVLELSFEEFSRIKALRMETQAEALMRRVVIENSYINSDTDGYAFRINSSNNELKLEILGFDLEYYSTIDRDRRENILHAMKESEKASQYFHGITFSQWWKGVPVSLAERAGFFAILALELNEKLK